MSLGWLTIGAGDTVRGLHLLREAMSASRARGHVAGIVDGLLESVCLTIKLVVRVEALCRHTIHTRLGVRLTLVVRHSWVCHLLLLVYLCR
jgi:hypothetical protein